MEGRVAQWLMGVREGTDAMVTRLQHERSMSYESDLCHSRCQGCIGHLSALTNSSFSAQFGGQLSLQPRANLTFADVICACDMWQLYSE